MTAAALLAADIDQDIKAAVVTRWKGDAALNALDAIGPRDGKLEGNRPDTYVTISVGAGSRANECFGNGAGGAVWKIFRTVTLTWYGKKDTISGALQAMAAVFRARLWNQLVMPSGANVFRLYPKDLGRQEQDDTKDKKAQEIWRGVYEFEVGTVRGDV